MFLGLFSLLVLCKGQNDVFQPFCNFKSTSISNWTRDIVTQASQHITESKKYILRLGMGDGLWQNGSKSGF